MLHVPIDMDIETALDADVKSWLAFAAQKTDELVMLALALALALALVLALVLAEGRDEIAAGEVAEISNLIMLARDRLLVANCGVNSNCGLKTRRWEEVRPALMNMVAAARAIREKAEVSVTLAGGERQRHTPVNLEIQRTQVNRAAGGETPRHLGVAGPLLWRVEVSYPTRPALRAMAIEGTWVFK
ncbi:MAG: hypothetical protein E5W44_02200 [Mesorhizobium sp.]|nr:MAG: hypothetical protein E5W44_02200 [Mesorhizobium sp.]